MKKTALQQLIEKLEETKMTKCKHLHEFVFFDGVLAIIEAGGYLEIEKQDIIEAYQSGSEFALDATNRQAEQYYNKTFKQ